ncbi:acetylornithine deacetylase [Cochlodiniinecator piscidefendens]|uniref:acetylornithine deacetylase n=1 Tax=Cochlodiniinecator piscidefendens TaxID=2715756 RepID=UPI001408D11D|nr:acetylornithine deacetylase [Cochlodiniinecator piscidefendens]
MTTTVDILERLIGFNSVSANSNLDIIAYIEGFLKERGFSVHRLPDATGEKAGIFASIGPAGAGVLLSGHTDVVPVTGQVWTKDPFKLTKENGRLYGRGTTDMKGYVASALALADRASRAELKEPLKLAFSYDEEVGCVGIKHMIGALEDTIGLPRMCFVGEPTEMNVAIGHKGKAALRVTCHGTSGHSALAPKFVNALHLATEFVSELRHMQDKLIQDGAYDAAYDFPHSTVHVGKLTGGVALNIVPDQAVLDFEYRHLPGDSPEMLFAQIKDRADRVSAKFDAQSGQIGISVDQYNAYPGLDVSPDAHVVNYAQNLVKSNTCTKVPFGTEAGYFHNLGIPTIVCGPGSMDGQGHQPDEYVSEGQISKCDQMMDRLLVDLTH